MKKRELDTRTRERFRELLALHCSSLEEGSVGWKIHCPFHDDNNPSCTVFYNSGVFSCLSCGARKGPFEGLLKLGVAREVVEQVAGKGREDELPEKLMPLEEVDVHVPPDFGKQEQIEVLSESPWNPKWNYRGVKGTFLAEDKLFQPSLVRLGIQGKDGAVRQEKFSRLALAYGSHRLYLRLSSEQEVRIYNSPGLSLSDPVLPPFGMAGFRLRSEAVGLVLVEGPYDLLRTQQNLNTIGVGGCFEVAALLGVSQWRAFLEKFELRILPWLGRVPVMLAFDNDPAGEALTREAEKALRRLGAEVLVLRYPGKDPGDLDADALLQALLKLGF